jgi:hypothetical protein
VNCTAKEVGSSYNTAAFTITRFTQQLSFLQSVINEENVLGGSDDESLESFTARALRSIRVRNPVTEGDFQNLAQELLGPNSLVKVIANMDGDRRVNIPGSFHAFCLSDAGLPSNQSELSKVAQRFREVKYIGTTPYVSAMELRDLDVNVVVKILPGFTFPGVADALYNKFIEYFDPKTFDTAPGVLLSELNFALRSTAGIKFIDEISLNGSNLNVPLEYFEFPYPKSLRMTLIDENSFIFETARGDLDGH